MAVEIKICGLTRRQDVDFACDLGAHYLGFIFHAPSPRHVDTLSASELLSGKAAACNRVAVLVDPSDDAAEAAIRAIGATHLQLHGQEAPERICQLRARFSLPIIKAIGIGAPGDLAKAAIYADCADFLLFDTRIGDASGGTGKTFDWSILKGYDAPLPWFLSGGLSTENLEAAYRQTGARRFDASSRLEYAPGLKDEEKMSEFFAEAAALS